jgi:hypothetical protein
MLVGWVGEAGILIDFLWGNLFKNQEEDGSVIPGVGLKGER